MEGNRCGSQISSAQVSAVTSPTPRMLFSRFTRFTSSGSFCNWSSNCRCVAANVSSAPRLSRNRSFTDSGTSSSWSSNSLKYFAPCSRCLLYSAPTSINSPLIRFFICTASQILHRFRHFFQLVQQLAEIFCPVQSLFAVFRSHFHQQPAHSVLHLHRLPHHQVPVAQQPSQIAHLRRSHIADRQQIAAHQVGDLARIQFVVLLLGSPDGFHHRGVPHLQLGGKRLQHVVNPTAE